MAPLVVVVDDLPQTSTLIIQGADNPLNNKALASTKCPPRPHHEMRPVGEIVCGLKLITTQAFVLSRLTNGFLGVLLRADIQGCNRTSPNPFLG